ncbi:MAG: hypothetical protein OEZ04_05245 [Nitrospinota bacterium]|nr:hypothetical protein [Nitrospinota bacterium]
MNRLSADIASNSPALRPLDDTVEYIRANSAQVVPLYIVGVAPMTVAIFMLLDTVSTGRYSALPEGCMLLTGATVWKWAWGSAVQARVQEALSGRPGAPLLGRLTYIITLKLVASMAMLWGSFLILPAIYGFFLSGMAAPILLDGGRFALEGGRSALEGARWATRWVGDSMSRALKIISAISMLFLVVYLGVTLLQLLVTHTIMPSFLGMDPTELSLTIWGWSWQMAILYMLFLIFDLYWMVASVLLYHDIQSRRAGVDLGQRLTSLGG